jgi:hypothetical protein
MEGASCGPWRTRRSSTSCQEEDIPIPSRKGDVQHKVFGGIPNPCVCHQTSKNAVEKYDMPQYSLKKGLTKFKKVGEESVSSPFNSTRGTLSNHITSPS